jgi:hypothetical protein
MDSNTHKSRKKKSSVLIILSALLAGSCESPYSKLSIDHRKIVEYYFTREAINECGIRIDTLEYRKDIYGRTGFYGDADGHGEISYGYLDENPSENEKSVNGTLKFQPLPEFTLDQNPAEYLTDRKMEDKLFHSAKDMDINSLRKNVRGWIVNGYIGCRLNRKRFILLEDYGMPIVEADVSK